MKFRFAGESDLDTVFDLWLDLMTDHQAYSHAFRYKPGSKKSLKAKLLNRIRSTDEWCLMAIVDKEVIGLTMLKIHSKSPESFFSHKGYIAETVIHQKFRSQGVGKSLFEEAKKWFLTKGIDHIELQVSVRNQRGIKFWEELGFEPISYHMVLPITSSEQ